MMGQCIGKTQPSDRIEQFYVDDGKYTKSSSLEERQNYEKTGFQNNQNENIQKFKEIQVRSRFLTEISNNGKEENHISREENDQSYRQEEIQGMERPEVTESENEVCADQYDPSERERNSLSNLNSKNDEEIGETKHKKKKKKKERRIEPTPISNNTMMTQAYQHGDVNEDTKISERHLNSNDCVSPSVIELKKKKRSGLNILVENTNEVHESIKCMSYEVERLANNCTQGTQKIDIDPKNCCPKKFTKSLKCLAKHISDLKSTNSQLRIEKDEYINRLSDIAGNRLLDNNPSIANLGDQNRPTKLAENFSKLYDDEWTDVYDALVKKNVQPETAIYHLYGTLKAVYDTCKQKSDVQLNGMAEHLFLISNPSSQQLQTMLISYTFEHKKLVDLRKETAMDAIYMIQQTIREDGIFKQKVKMSNPVLEDCILHDIYDSSYFEKCIELCWLMVIQDPPMYIELEPLEGTKLDKDAYKEYTKAGKTIQYVVWPALYLFCNDKRGPLMLKGVVQPM